MSIISYCPQTNPWANLTATKCVGDIMVWTESMGFALTVTLAFLPLMALVAWIVMRDKNDAEDVQSVQGDKA